MSPRRRSALLPALRECSGRAMRRQRRGRRKAGARRAATVWPTGGYGSRFRRTPGEHVCHMTCNSRAAGVFGHPDASPASDGWCSVKDDPSPRWKLAPTKNRAAQPDGGARRRGKNVSCRQYPLRGATRCKLHGGLQQVLPPGDPRRGGRPAVHRLYCRTLTPEMVDAYRAADPGTLEHEIRIACANAARLQALFDANPARGIAVSVTRGGTDNRSMHVYPYAQLLQEQLDLIRKLKLAQTVLEAAKRGDNSALIEWASAWSHRGVAHRSRPKLVGPTAEPRRAIPKDLP